MRRLRADDPATPPPPWLWLLVLSYLPMLPGDAVWWRDQVTELWADGAYSTARIGPAALAALRATTVSQAMPTLVLLSGIAAVALPRLRGRYTEWRYALVSPPPGSPAEDTLRALHRALAPHAPPVTFTVSMAGRAPSIRVYPRGRRERRVALSLGFLALWRRSPERARALLAHEAAHLARGEHLIAGLGSPFAGAVAAWPVVFLVCGAAPVGWLLLVHAPTAPEMLGQVVVVVMKLPQTLLLPVLALWCAELAADRYALAVAGGRGMAEALHASRESGVSRVWGRAHHPPRRLRLWCLARARRPVVPLLLWTAGPVALLLHAVVLTAGGVLGLLALGDPPGAALATALALAHRGLLTPPVWAALTVLPLAWPLLAGVWGRLWGAPRAASPPAAAGSAPFRETSRARRLPLPLTAALLPLAVLAVALLPPSGALARDPVLGHGTAAAAAAR
ncbi:hypothetical protein [Streptomyces kronopolitis]|uniref:hypothetical protein n=1 Tax=Streptomyces kronopolitis TaxID=1612435 RepID=UPI003444BF52